jgi:hypothetical protein
MNPNRPLSLRQEPFNIAQQVIICHDFRLLTQLFIGQAKRVRLSPNFEQPPRAL